MGDDNSSHEISGQDITEDKRSKKKGRKLLLDPGIMNQFFIERKDKIIVEKDGKYKPISKNDGV